MRSKADWAGYLARFHAERAGITESVLGQARDGAGRTPYDWAAEPVAPGLTVLDVACGSAPMHRLLRARSYVGIDFSAAELAGPAGRGVPVARADASRLPLGDGTVDAVVMSMALMLLPLPVTLQEVRRVLRPAGVFVATVPVSRPMPPGDRLRYARLLLALRHRGLEYPNGGALADAGPPFAGTGLSLGSDRARTFTYGVGSRRAADQLLGSLYLPDTDPRRTMSGRRVVRRWVGTTIAIPVRRLVATAV